MKSSILTPPDAFSVAPLLSLLPIKGNIAKLDSYTSAFFARYDQVNQLRSAAQTSGDAEGEQKYALEEAMLRQVLDWLAVKPD